MLSQLALQPRPRPVLLLIGRDPRRLRPLVDELGAQGYDVRVARTRRQALDAVAGTPVELAIVEHAAPRMDGLRLIRSLREATRGKQLPIFLVAARPTSALEERALRAGAGLVLRQPLDVDQVVTLVRFAT